LVAVRRCPRVEAQTPRPDAEDRRIADRELIDIAPLAADQRAHGAAPSRSVVNREGLSFDYLIGDPIGSDIAGNRSGDTQKRLS
jgi:hypothetical protein